MQGFFSSSPTSESAPQPAVVSRLSWPSPQFIVGTGLCTLALTSIYCRDWPLQLDWPSPLLGDLRPGDTFLAAIVVFPLLLTAPPLRSNSLPIDLDASTPSPT
jgi:hypothetical protein